MVKNIANLCHFWVDGCRAFTLGVKPFTGNKIFYRHLGASQNNMFLAYSVGIHSTVEKRAKRMPDITVKTTVNEK